MIIISSGSAPAKDGACSKSRQTEGSSALSINYLASVALYKQAPLVERRVPLHSQLLPNVPLIYYWARKSRTGCCAPDPPWSPLCSALIRMPLSVVGRGVRYLLQCPNTSAWGRVRASGLWLLRGSHSCNTPWWIIRVPFYWALGFPYPPASSRSVVFWTVLQSYRRSA